ncbi:hypothetical protein ASG52_20155 [Methylobacterium sp. Leaf456]|uniref:DUF4166 domain-containing protein n=1 Tax=Methylobacterium sp. Leaf456 TaxID=1736382 RepID=UPI0006F30965|nr:DUF4166 domain-containing protein [Methylobacterium sp. Leaf456]KQT59702.1 hypothetical protein ASG52_20155 [Methylobacterium sp. Leaf456]
MSEPGGTLYRAILGSALDALPAPVRALHDGIGTRRFTGSASVRRGNGLLARLLCALFRFPDTASDVAVSVTFAQEPGGERWTRTIGRATVVSFQSAGTGRDRALLIERFGLAAFALALIPDGDRLRFVPRRWSILKIPMPGFLLPVGESFETERDGRFAFDITVSVPLVGLVVAYRGTLAPAEAVRPS